MSPVTRKKAPARKAAGSRQARSRKAPSRKASARGGRSRQSGRVRRRTLTDATDQHTVSCIESTARDLYTKILKKRSPEMKTPVRSLSNVHFDPKIGYLKIGKSRKVRTLTVNTVKTFAQTLKMMHLSREMIAQDTFATKREAYYVSKNWEEARFKEQPESDTVMDDIEALFSLEGISREQLRFYPEEHGGAVAGRLTVIDRDPVSGRPIEIDCTRFGTGAYTIPHSVEHLEFRTTARFILAIETGGMFQRLQTHGYWSQVDCIIISMGGVPTRATRRFIRRLSQAYKIPVYAFVDCDPYGISNIYRTLKVGSGNTAHLNRFFCVPHARFLGVTPQDIVDYQLPTHPLLPVDIKRAADALKNDPFFRQSKPWKKAIQQLMKMGVRAEQQALAKWGLNYVIEEYLPAKLGSTRSFLP
ncbi:MAG: DNA topoisomerase VI [Acidobacteriota bacterium]